MSDFKITIASDIDYERVCAEVSFGGKFVLLVSLEQGPGHEEVEFPGLGLDERFVLRNVPLKGLEAAIREAAERLWGD